MPSSNGPRGLRERKKIKTRAIIRHEAFKLFRSRGFHDTTIEQIAEAADVSPSTFFRYFPIKESVLVSDDMVQGIVDGFIDAPADLSLIGAYRHSIRVFTEGLSATERHEATVGHTLLYDIPAARGLLYSEWMSGVDRLTDAIAHRAQQPVSEERSRAYAAAMVGVVIAASNERVAPEKTGEHIDTALAALETLLPDLR